MKRKRNIYDADDAANSKRLHFSAEERAAHAEKKAEILGEKLEKAEANLPKKRRPRINREFDAMTGKVRHSLSFEDEVKPRSRKNPVTQAGLKAGRSVDLAAHSKIRQVEKENVGTEAAHKTEFAAENLATGAIRKGYHSIKDAPYRRVERLEVKSARATVNANYRAAIRDNPQLQKHSLSAMYGYVADGLFQSDKEVQDHANQIGAEPGRIRYKDLNDDGVINSDDRTWIGDGQPDLSYGVSLSLNYKNFDFNLFFNGVFGNDINVQSWKMFTDFYGLTTQGENYGTRLLDAWRPDNTSSTIPAITLNNYNDEGRFSTYFVESGSYLKLRNVELGYTLPEKALNTLKVDNVRFYLRADNVLTLKKHGGIMDIRDWIPRLQVVLIHYRSQ